MVNKRKNSDFDDDAEEEIVIELRPDNLPEIFVPISPNGGYGWVIVFAAFMISFVTDGLLCSFGVMLIPLQEHFKSKISVISLVGSLVIGFYSASGTIAAGMVNKYGCRSVVYMGTFISTIAILLSSISPTVGFLVFFYGVLGGIGMGLIYLPGIVAVSFYFDTKRAVATGITMAGSGVGSVFAPMALKLIFNNYDWSQAFVLIGGIVLHCAIFGSLLRPLRPPIDLGITAKREPMLKKIIRKFKNLKKLRLYASGDSKSSHSETGSQMFSVSLQNLNMDALPDHKIREYVHRYIKERGSVDMTSGFNLNTIHEDKVEEFSPASENQTVNHPLLQANTEIPAKSSEQPTTHIRSVQDLNTKRTSIELTDANRILRSLQGGIHQSDTLLNTNIPVQINTQQKDVALKDFSRPLYRKDIFYGGSIMDLDNSETAKVTNQSPNPILSSIVSISQAGTGVASVTDSGALWKSNLIMSMTRIPEGEEQLSTYHSTKESPAKSQKKCRLPKALVDILKMMMDLSLLKNKPFTCIFIANMFSTFGFFIPAFFALDYANSFKITQDNATYLLSIMGIANTIARLLFGWIGSLPRVSSVWMSAICLLFAGVACSLIGHCDNFLFIAVSMSVYGILVAPWLVLTTVILCELVGLDKLSNAFGLIAVARGLTASIGPPLAGVLYDMFKSYKLCYLVAGICMGISALFHLFVLLPSMKRQTVRFEGKIVSGRTVEERVT